VTEILDSVNRRGCEIPTAREVQSASNFWGNGQKEERTLVGQLERAALNSWNFLLHLKTKPDPAFETLFVSHSQL
jgi:hypothetical protein